MTAFDFWVMFALLNGCISLFFFVTNKEDWIKALPAAIITGIFLARILGCIG